MLQSILRAEVDQGVLRVFGGDGHVLLEGHGEALLTDGTVLSAENNADQLQWQVDSTRSDRVVIQLRLTTHDRSAARVEQLRPLVVPHGYRQLPLHQLRIQQTGWQSWSRTHPPAAFEANLQTAAPPIRGPYLPHRREDSQLEPWMTTLSA